MYGTLYNILVLLESLCNLNKMNMTMYYSIVFYRSVAVFNLLLNISSNQIILPTLYFQYFGAIM